MNFYGYDIKGFDVMDEGCQEMQFWNIDRYMNRLIGNTGISEGSGALDTRYLYHVEPATIWAGTRGGDFLGHRPFINNLPHPNNPSY